MNTDQLLEWINSITKEVFNGSQRQLAAAVSLSTSTVNRTLRPDTPAKDYTIRRNLVQMIRDLEEGGYITAEPEDYDHTSSDTEMVLENQDLGQLFQMAQSILTNQFNHNKSELGRHVSISQPTVNRTLRDDSDQKDHTRKRHLITILRDLEEAGYLPKENLGRHFVQDRTQITTEERGEAIAIPMATFKASAGNGNYVTETEELDRYVIDRKELGPAAQAALRKKGMILIEVEGDSMLKALQRRPGNKLVIISRNDTYPNYTVNLNDDPDLEVIGKVWGRFQRLG